MKILVVTDLEGVGGIFTARQSKPKYHPADEFFHCYQEARRLLTADVNAAVQGAMDGGCDEIVVWDAHSRGYNLLLEEVHPGAEYIVGEGYRMFPIDGSFDAMAMLGVHAMAGTPNGVLEHTQGFDVHFYSVNGVEMGETGQFALVAGHYDVPVVFVSSDSAGCVEARRLLGDHIITLSTKTGLAREGAQLKAPALCRGLIRAGLRQAMSLVGDPAVMPFKLAPPYHVVVESIAERTHPQTDEELAGRTHFVTHYERVRDTVPYLDCRDPV
jgi:D-amino peptidase